jgi:NADH-quinone oxidoreductase subunit L
MLIGALALTGIPPLAGFFSKDSILASALDSGTYGQLLFAAGLAGAFLTGLYTFRMIFIVFGGDPSPYAREHFHTPERGGEGPFSMTSTVAVLAILSVVGGWLQFAGLWHPLSDFLQPSVESLVEPSGTQDLVASILAVGLGIAGILVARQLYGVRRVRLPEARFWRDLLERKFYFDDAYAFVFYRPAAATARLWTRVIEGPLIGGSIEGVSTGTRRLGRGVGEAQTGLVRTYALALAGSVAVLALVFVSVR